MFCGGCLWLYTSHGLCMVHAWTIQCAILVIVGVMNHTFPYHSHLAPQRPISTFESILIFQFDFELLPNLRNCQDIPNHSAPSCGLSCRFSRVTTSRGIQDHHAYMHFNGPKRNTSIDQCTNQSDDITADLPILGDLHPGARIMFSLQRKYMGILVDITRLLPNSHFLF